MKSENDGDKKPKINLNPDSFYGIIDHKEILQKLLSEIKSLNFREYIRLEDDRKLMQKHIIFAVVKNLIEIAKVRKWNLCKAYEYIYIYNGAYWKQCSKDDIKSFLCEVAIKMGHPDYESKADTFPDKLLKQFLNDAYLPEPATTTDKILINLQNGTFEFTTGGWVKREFSPEDFLTYQLPFKYDESAICPMFDKYLLRVVPDEKSRMVLQEFAGYIFTKLNLEKCLVLTGGGGNGKSVFMNILCALFGNDNILQYSLGQFSHEYNRAKLANVLLNYSSEKGFDLNPDTFKALVSGEALQAREIYQKPFTLYNRAKFITNCNELPRETESTDAYFRRFLIVPFEEKISENEKDTALAEKIIATELPGVFNWLLAGLDRLLAQERGKEKFTLSEKAENALGEFRKQSDSLQLFIEDKGYMPSEHSKKSLTEIYDEYKNYCKDDGYKPLGKNRFSRRLEAKGFKKERINAGVIFYVVKLCQKQ